MQMLKNQDHHNAGKEGNFSAFLWNAGGMVKPLGAIADSDAPTFTIYEVRGDLKGITAGNYTVQTVYYTDNSAAPPAFFQCSDIVVLGASQEQVAKALRGHHH